jgi:hypothetical protein
VRWIGYEDLDWRARGKLFGGSFSNVWVLGYGLAVFVRRVRSVLKFVDLIIGVRSFSLQDTT